MKPHPRTALRTCALIGLTLLAAACGGGSDAPGPAPAPPSAPSTPVTITATNRDAVASTAANAFVGLGAAGTPVPLASGNRVVAAAKGAAIDAGGLSLDTRSVGALLSSAAVQSALAPLGAGSNKTADVIRPLATVVQTQQCLTSGTVTATFNDNDNNGQFTAGDSLSLSFAQCREGTATINGTIGITYVSVTRGTTISAQAVVAFSNLVATAPDGSFSLNGSLSVAAGKTGSVTTGQIQVGAGGLTAAVAAPGYNDTITYGAGLTIATTDDEATGVSTLAINGTISSTRCGGTIAIQTVTPVRQLATDLYPSAGQVIVTGASGSKLRMTVLNATTVRIELDVNGDGTYESSVDKPWNELI